MPRTTIYLEERLDQAVRERARELGSSVSAFIAKAVDDALKRIEPRDEKPFRLITAGGGGPLPGIDTDRIREFEVLEDVAAHLELRDRRDRDRD